MSRQIVVELVVPADFPVIALERAIAELANENGCSIRRDGLSYALHKRYFPRCLPTREAQDAA
jgi:hypothetical protein